MNFPNFNRDTRITVITVEADDTLPERSFDVYTLGSYTTPYYYTKELGSVNHYPTLRRLHNALKRAIKAGKL